MTISMLLSPLQLLLFFVVCIPESMGFISVQQISSVGCWGGGGGGGGPTAKSKQTGKDEYSWSVSSAFGEEAEADDDSTTTKPTTATRKTIRMVLDMMRDSSFIESKHIEHCESASVTHLFKGTPLVDLPSELKLKFVDSWAGRILSTVMEEEQSYLGEWKVNKILEAAGDYNSTKIIGQIMNDIHSSPVVIYSFVDCPWCIAVKTLLQSYPYYCNNDNNKNTEEGTTTTTMTVIELEELGLKGKHIRSELAKMTGRTSMPCIFIGGQPIGGFTEGDPCGPGLKSLHESGQLLSMINNISQGQDSQNFPLS